jgi:hypothetical protein
MRWFVVLIAAAEAIAIGVLMLYLGRLGPSRALRLQSLDQINRSGGDRDGCRSFCPPEAQQIARYPAGDPGIAGRLTQHHACGLDPADHSRRRHRIVVARVVTMIRHPNIRDLLTRGSGLRRFAVGLMTALLAAVGAWPTPGLLGDSESKRKER